MTNNNQDEISIKEILLTIHDWLNYFRTKWRLLLISLLIGLLIGFSLSFKQTTKYTAILTYILEDGQSNGGSSGNFGGLNSFSSSLGFGMSPSGGGLYSSANLSDLMKSRFIFYKVLLHPVKKQNKEITLADYYLQLNNPSDNKLKFIPKSDPNTLNVEQIEILRNIYNDLSSEDKLSFQSKEKKTAFSQVVVTYNDEQFAKILCETLIEVTSESYIESKVKKVKTTVEVLERQLDSVRYNFNSSLVDFAKANDNIYNLNPALKAKGTQPTRKQIDVQANTALLNSLINNLESAKAALRNQTPLFQVIDQPSLPLSKEITPNRTKSIIIFGLLSLIISIILLTFKRIYKTIMQSI